MTIILFMYAVKKSTGIPEYWFITGRAAFLFSTHTEAQSNFLLLTCSFQEFQRQHKKFIKKNINIKKFIKKHISIEKCIFLKAWLSSFGWKVKIIKRFFLNVIVLHYNVINAVCFINYLTKEKSIFNIWITSFCN